MKNIHWMQKVKKKQNPPVVGKQFSVFVDELIRVAF